jgi:hypothetical protein
VCSKWKVTGKVEADPEANILPNVMEFVRKEITKHPLHGVGGRWQINYGLK